MLFDPPGFLEMIQACSDAPAPDTDAAVAEAMIEELASRYGHNPEKIRIEKTGKRPGEKGYEELMTEEETKHAYETENMFIALPEKQNYEAHKAQVNKYISENTNLLTKEEIKAMLRENFTLESLR